MVAGRSESLIGRLVRWGFTDAQEVFRLLQEPATRDALAGLLGEGSGSPEASRPGEASSPGQLIGYSEQRLLSELGQTASPNAALSALLRLLPAAQKTDLVPQLLQLTELRTRLFAVLAGSTALADHLIRHPDHFSQVLAASAAEATPGELLLSAVGASIEDPCPIATLALPQAYDALRVAYRRQLLAIAAADLSAPDPLAILPEIARRLAELADAALAAALAIAQSQLSADSPPCRFAVIAMGKCGAQELNYVSDVDVIFVAQGLSLDPAQEQSALATATKLATFLMRACSADTAEGTLWPVDANLRPEGGQGPLVRTVNSHRAYYQRWAKTWEFQALLKARFAAGDADLGGEYCAAIQPLVWQAAGRENFVADVQAMRRRVEAHLPAKDADRELKLGPGGIRDIEFSVQLLQLVHGRIDATLRAPDTLSALSALADNGYIARDDAANLSRAYRLLRVLEHRIQLFRLRRTHVLPTDRTDLRLLGRELGFRANPDSAIQAHWSHCAREVRRLHERIFYRPLLGAAAALTTDQAELSPAAAQLRLAALGYRDPAGALRHLNWLAGGVSRTAAIQRQLLPILLGWFAAEADPDAGLLAFRRISDGLGRTHWYLKMLRDEGSSAERLAHLLARSRFAGELLVQAPESVQLLADDAGLVPRTAKQLHLEMQAVVRRQDDPVRAVLAARSVRRRELFRIATADLMGKLALDDVERALTDVAAALIQCALGVACASVQKSLGRALPTRVLVVAMGRFGGAELGYGSDADVIFVHEPDDGQESAAAQEAALAVVTELRRLLAGPGPDPALELDADLRPEGKNGPMVRSLAAYREYYRRWSLVWEAQALLRATPIAGDAQLAERFTALVDTVRWPQGGISGDNVREVRRVKARIEAERLPRGADRGLHLKLGRGGMADVEWAVQLVQLRHAWEHPGLRHTGTMTALQVATEAGFIHPDDARILAEAWTLASRLRNAAVLWRGRPVDALPSDWRDLDGIARIIGYQPGSTADLLEDYPRLARRARSVVERIFYA